MSTETILIDEITRYTDHTSRILIALATVGIATDGQLIRLCHQLSDREEYLLYLGSKEQEKYRAILAEADRMERFDSYLGKERDVQLPKYMGGGLTAAWYLTAKGLAAVTTIDQYFARYAAAGMPCGTKKDRIPHELAVTESFLKLAERQTICDFIPERELKSRIMKRRNELRKQIVGFNDRKDTRSEETGDFRAVLLPKNTENSERWEIEGEAAINYRRSQLEAKPDQMVWFVTSKTQKEMVIATKKDKLKAVWIIGDVCQPLKFGEDKSITKKEKSKRQRHTKIEVKVNEYLLRHRLQFTGKALSIALKEDWGNVTRVLKRLEERQKVQSDEIKLTPTRRSGRPNKLYWHTDNDEIIGRKRADRMRSLVISEAICFFGAREYRFTQYTETVRQADFKPLETEKYADLRVVIESPDATKTELKNKIELANIGAEKKQIDVVIAVSTTERYEEISDICRKNICFVIENKKIIKP